MLILLVVGGCAGQPRTDSPAQWVERTAALAGLGNWSLSGRIALQLTDRGFNGSFNWQQEQDQLRANFSGPFGAGATRIHGDTERLVLETANGDTFLLDDPEAALERELGWSVPMHALRYWLIGLPYPDAPATQDFDETGRLSLIEQLDWKVDYQRYVSASGWDMPRKMVLTRSDQLRIKLVISNWALPEPR